MRKELFLYIHGAFVALASLALLAVALTAGPTALLASLLVVKGEF